MPAKTPAKVGSKPASRTHAPVSDQDRVVSLAGGTYAYVFMADGTSRHLATSSPEFLASLHALAEAGYASRITTQLRTLALTPGTLWPRVLAEYEAGLSPA